MTTPARVPYCMYCPLFKRPTKIGEKATCAAYSKGIPEKIYPYGANCNKKPKGVSRPALPKPMSLEQMKKQVKTTPKRKTVKKK